MIYTPEPLALILFGTIVLTVLGLSIFMARKGTSSKTYFAAGGSIPWQVNGIAFAGDYLSAASFLGICGMIAVAGYDGFLYSIGYLAGWIVALFVIAEPMKRLGRYTFADALDARYNFKGIRLAAGISTLAVSIFYLIPQMVGAGALVVPLLGFPHWLGVVLVGTIVIVIVATAGMKSTTWVQFIKGGLLVIFSFILVAAILNKGLSTHPQPDTHKFVQLSLPAETDLSPAGGLALVEQKGERFVQLEHEGAPRWWRVLPPTEGTGPAAAEQAAAGLRLEETLTISSTPGGTTLYNGRPKEAQAFYQVGQVHRLVVDGREVEETGPLDPLAFLRILQDSEILLFSEVVFSYEGQRVRLWYPDPTPGREILRLGQKFKVDEGATWLSKLNFLSLMLALFLGTAALPHVLIRYYTVPSPRDARKSTILAIVAIGLFYILPLFIGLGGMTGGVIDLDSNNMAAPLLAKSFGTLLFAIISAIAFATVLGTVSGLIVASAGAVAHDLVDGLKRFVHLPDDKRVLVGKLTSVTVGVIAILLGIVFKEVNVSFLVGLAFNVAASANFPALIGMIFWKGTSARGITASVLVGMGSSLGLILLSPTFWPIYGLNAADAPVPLENPAIVAVPLSFLTLWMVSKLRPDSAPLGASAAAEPAPGTHA